MPDSDGGGWWRDALALAVVVLVAGGFVFITAAAIQRYAPPRAVKTCTVHYTFSDHITYGSEWEVAEDEECGVAYIQSDDLG